MPNFTIDLTDQEVKEAWNKLVDSLKKQTGRKDLTIIGLELVDLAEAKKYRQDHSNALTKGLHFEVSAALHCCTDANGIYNCHPWPC